MEETNREYPQTAISWLWEELQGLLGLEEAADIKAGYDEQNRRYQQAVRDYQKRRQGETFKAWKREIARSEKRAALDLTQLGEDAVFYPEGLTDKEIISQYSIYCFDLEDTKDLEEETARFLAFKKEYIQNWKPIKDDIEDNPFQLSDGFKQAVLGDDLSQYTDRANTDSQE